MKRMLFICAIIAVSVATVFVAGRLTAQSRVGMSPGGLLSACSVSASKELAFCNVANDPANPDGLYLSANAAPYFRVSAASSGPTITGTAPIVVSPAGVVSCPTCAVTSGVVNSFNGRTGNVTLTKPDVIGTGIAVATTVTSTATSTPQ